MSQFSCQVVSRGVPCVLVVVFDVFKHNETYRDYSSCGTEHSEPNTPRLVGNDLFREKVGGGERRADEQKLCKPQWRLNQITELARAEDDSDCQRQREKAAHEELRLLTNEWVDHRH